MLYYIRIHCGNEPSSCDVVGPFTTMMEAYEASRLILSGNDKFWKFSYVNETTRRKSYDDREIMPHEYYH